MRVHWALQRSVDLPGPSSWLAAGELALAAGLSHEKRRADWLLGRWTIKRALAAYERLAGRRPPSFVELEVPAARDGAPDPRFRGVRIGHSISLSHRGGIAVCALAPAGTELGCDLELVEPRSEAFVADYLTESERLACRQATGHDAVLLPNLYWSARESVLKALRLGLSVDTRRVTVRLGKRDEGREWQAFEASFRREVTGEPRRYTGWWRRRAGYVVTIATHPAAEPPEELVLGEGRDVVPAS